MTYTVSSATLNSTIPYWPVYAAAGVAAVVRSPTFAAEKRGRERITLGIYASTCVLYVSFLHITHTHERIKPQLGEWLGFNVPINTL